MKLTHAPKTLTEYGFDHIMLSAFVFVIFGIIGTAFLVASHAATPSLQWKGLLEPFSGNSGYCLTASGAIPGKSTAELQKCSTTPDNNQTWSLYDIKLANVDGAKSVQEFYLKNGAGNVCLDDYGHKTTKMFPAKLYTCSKTNTAVTFIWGKKFAVHKYSTNQLANVASGTTFAKALCLDDDYGSKAQNNPVGLFPCKKTTKSNQEWFEHTAPTVSGGSGGSGTTSSSSDFVAASSQSLMLNGKDFKFIGFNAGMAGVCWSDNWTTTQMDTYFSNLPANGMTRIFAVEPVGTSFVSTIVNEAAKYNQHLILVLGDDDSNCGDTNGSPSGAGSGKTAAFYESGWKSQYLTWVNTIVPMFKNSPTIAMWEIANEPFSVGATGSQLGLTTMENYLNGTAAAIRADDPNHLITVGSTDTSSYGSLSNYIAAQSGSNINVLDFHDYAWDYENGATESGNFSQEQSAGEQLNKPYMIDEAGVEAGPGCTSSTPDDSANGHGLSYADRVTYLTNKANDYLSAGASGIDFWDYEQVAQSNCSYEFVPSSDPMINAVKDYQVPS